MQRATDKPLPGAVRLRWLRKDLVQTKTDLALDADEVKVARRQGRRARLHSGGKDRGAEDTALRRKADLPAADPLSEAAQHRILYRVRISFRLLARAVRQRSDRLTSAGGPERAACFVHLLWRHSHLLN